MDIDQAALREGLLTFIIIVAGIAIHEWGHAVVADLLGDDTPRAEGRVTLNPLVHMDMIGTIIVPIVNIFVFGGALPFIGWGKPVNTNPSNYGNRARDEVLIPLAGPAANLLFALLAVVAGAFVVTHQPRFGELVRNIVVMNVGLAVFNLIPVPPLDGAAMIRRIVGMSEETYLMLSKWSWVIVLVMIKVGPIAAMITWVFSLTLYPYVRLCDWISPDATFLIFQS